MQSIQPNIKDEATPVLCVDLDGTLVRTDSLIESMFCAIRKRFWILALLPVWAFRGRAVLKRRIAEQCIPDPAFLPYRESLLTDLREQHRQGRVLALVTAADELIANSVANHLKIFDRIIASDGKTNLKGSRKAARLVSDFGRGGYDYVGDTTADIPVWENARQRLLACATPGVMRAAERRGITLDHIYEKGIRSSLKTWMKLLRLHQWLKNVLIFVPLITSLSLLRFDLVGKGVLAFVAFGLVASAIYVMNDLLDIQVDRRHPRKRQRAFASGAIAPANGVVLSIVLMALGIGLAYAFLPVAFVATLVLYTVSTTAYSLHLKQVVLVDVFMLAFLYTLRIVAGSFVFAIDLSFWLLAFSVFFFLNLALLKRFTELGEALAAGIVWIAGRGYKSSDLRLLMSLGTSCGCLAVLVLAFYINSPQVMLLYARPQVLWLLCPTLLYWVARMWMQAERSNMDDDPLVFAARDRVTWLVVLVSALVISAAAWPK